MLHHQRHTGIPAPPQAASRFTNRSHTDAATVIRENAGAQATHILRSYRNANNIDSIDVVAPAALILATNTSLRETQTVTIPPRPEKPFPCRV